MSETKYVRVTIVNESNSGRRRGWTKWVQSVDKSKRNGFAFAGVFVNESEIDLPVGAVLVQKNPQGSVKNGWDSAECFTLGSDGKLYRTCRSDEYKWDTHFLSFRDHVAEQVDEYNKQPFDAATVAKKDQEPETPVADTGIRTVETVDVSEDEFPSCYRVRAKTVDGVVYVFAREFALNELAFAEYFAGLVRARGAVDLQHWNEAK
jgi:hypothetical protein